MAAPPEPPPLDSVDLTTDAMPFAAIALVGLIVLFVLMAVVRWWGSRPTKVGPTAGLSLLELRRQLDAGLLSEKEYETIRARLAGGTPPAAAPSAADSASRKPSGGSIIEDTGQPPADPERSRTDGEE